MRGAIGRAGVLLAVESFVKDLDRDVSLAGESALGADRGACTSAGFHRFRSLKGHPMPSVAPPIRENFMSILGRCVRALSLSDSHRVAWGVVSSWGVEYRAALRKGRASDFDAALRARDRDAALEGNPSKRSRAR